MRSARALNTTEIRMSDSFLLSDFMVNDSVVRHGYPNRIYDRDEAKLEEGRFLAHHIEQLMGHFGPCGISYGFISPSLSGHIVHYQDPNIPSFHRWDYGAAADLIFPEMLEEGNNQKSPIALVYEIEQQSIGYSRLITYAESPWICFGTRRSEGTNQRRVLYENRYEGVRQPHHVKYPSGKQMRLDRLLEAQENPHEWQGRGWPSYHGKGRLQLQHQGVSKYTTMLKFLANPELIHKGVPNMPPVRDTKAMERWWKCADQAGTIIDSLTTAFDTHISVTSAYVAGVTGRDWQDFATLEFALPYGAQEQDVREALDLPEVKSAKLVYEGMEVPKVRVICNDIEE